MSFPRPPRDDAARETKMFQAAMPEASLIIHGPPDFPEDAVILGVLGLSDENADRERYGWIEADFVSWKTLLGGVRHNGCQASTET